MSPRRTRVARTSRPRPARRAMLLTRRAKANAARPRRGVLLLVVLSLLVLFLMVGTAFVITAKQSEKAAKSSMKASVRIAGEAAQADLLDEVLHQIVRDTNNPHSSLRFHSLLGDMYGNDGLKTRVAAANWASAIYNDGTNPTGGQILELGLDPTTVRDLAGVEIDAYGNFYDVSSPPPNVPRFGPYDNAYNGQVLTFLSGPVRGRSTRIVGFIPPNRLRVMNFNVEDGTPVSNPTAQIPATTRILINGRPFSGTGFGFNRAATTEGTPKLSLLERINPDSETPLLGPMALLPNNAFINVARLTQDPGNPPPANPTAQQLLDSAGTLLPGAHLAKYFDSSIPQHVTGRLTLANQIGPAGIGGANESYDAVDFQNMALAILPGANQLLETPVSVSDLANTGYTLPQMLGFMPPPSPTGPPPQTIPMVIPSWHRPELINYWATQLIPSPPTGKDIRDSILSGSEPGYAMALRRILMRPNWLDHPNFSGSNPEFAATPSGSAGFGQKLARMVYGPWDVDNDNDGTRDSIWVDVGLPVMAGPNGKLVKPLAAIMVIDMDGRLNVNAHGTCDMAEVGPGVSLTAPSDLLRGVLADGTNATLTPRGVGYGPADVSLRTAIGGDDFYRLLTGRYETGHADAGQPVRLPNGQPVGPGRYGQDDQATFRPGRQLQYDALSQIERAGWPQSADGIDSTGTFRASNFATPPDLRGRFGLAVNYYGQPVFEATLSSELQRGNPWKNLISDSPYELNLSQKTAAGVQGYASGSNAADAPFTVAELERLLRQFDADAGTLPSRLYHLSGVSQNNGATDARRLTTDSFDLPTPNVAMPHELTPLVSANPVYRRLPRSTAELFEIRIRAAMKLPPFPEPLNDVDDANNNGIQDVQEVRSALRRILAPELAEGSRLNINRALGNGFDDNNNGVVDEPGETVTGIYNDGAETPLVAFDPTAGAIPDAANAFSNSTATFPLESQEIMPDGSIKSIDHRQYLARHLYCLALTLTAPPNYCETGTPTKRDEDLARRLAQWAINVVDFRDADGAMTPFEYDINPFDGWDVDGYIGGARFDRSQSPPRWISVSTSGGNPIDHCGPDGKSSLAQPKFLVDDTIVWGAENPELAITETLAWHDRRTDDDMIENPYPETGDRELMMGAPQGQTPDDDFDQIYRPRGAAFIELYNPSEPRPSASADTHALDVRDVNGTMMRVDLGVNLAAVAADSDATYRSPVWRMLVHKRWRPNTNDPIPAEQTSRWDPDYPDSTDPLLHPVGSPDRCVYFAGFDPEKNRLQANDPNVLWDDDGVAYFNDILKNPVPPVRPGRYLVVGSGEDRDGDGVYESPIGDRKKIGDKKKLRSIALDTRNRPDKVRMVQPSGAVIADPNWNYLVQSPAEVPEISAPIPGITSASVADVAIIDQVFDPVDNYDDGPATTREQIGGKSYSLRNRRFTLSEPARGYVTNFNGSLWKDADQAYTSTTGFPAIDIPLDGPISDETSRSSDILQAQMDAQSAEVPPHMRQIDEVLTKIREDNSPNPPTNPLDVDPGASHSLIYLQRLANPMMPWNPMPAPAPNIRANGHNPDLPVNVYMTVDSNSANLTVFNSRGQSSEARRAREENDVDTNESMRRFASHERGYTAMTTDATLNTDAAKMASLWGNELPSIYQERQAAGAADLKHGAVSRYRQLSKTSPPAFPIEANSEFPIYGFPYHTLGFTNTTFQNRALIPPALVAGSPEEPGAVERKMKPKLPFDWLAWNNRPYISGNELMVVPRARSSQMLREASTYNPGSPYEKDSIPRPHRARQQRPFGHLTNYFLNSESDELVDPYPNVPTHLYRVLEYVHTPSLFVGTQNWVNPANFAATATLPINDPADPRFSKQAPYNSVSEYRDPGQINLNTIFSNDVWEGIFHGTPSRNGSGSAHVGPAYKDEYVKLRRGYDAASTALAGEQLALNGANPTFFAKPYRSPDSGDLVPIDDLMPTDGFEGIEGTLLRPIPVTGGSVAPLYCSGSTRKFDDASRHPYFNFGPMIRLDNLTTTRSNVFAVWVTIGFFEVEDVPEWSTLDANQRKNFNDDVNTFNRVYPEGYTFGREDGVDVGNTRRLRGFYIIDRTQMAGFEPGADHNIENTVRLRRRIE